MRFFDLLIMSINNLRRRKLRTGLTVLGVVIGTASIVVMVSLGIGLKENTVESYASFGSLTRIQISSGYGNQSEDDYLVDATVTKLAKIPHVKSVSPILETDVNLKQGVYQGYSNIVGMPREELEQIPLEADMIRQFQNYQNYEHQITGSLSDLTDAFTESFLQISVEQGAQEGLAFVKDVLGQFVSEEEIPEGDGSRNPEAVQNKTDRQAAGLQKNFTESALYKELKEIGASPEQLSNLVTNKGNGQQVLKEVLQLIDQNLKGEAGTPDFSEKLGKFLEGKEFKQLFKETLNRQLLLEPAEVAQEGRVDQLYEKLNQQMKSLNALLSDPARGDTALAKTVTNLNQNMDFMNAVNQNFSYIQIPLKMYNKETSGELFVYTNKKSLAKKDGNVSALLHLDMEYLGSVDVHVTLSQGQKVATKFYLQDDAALDLIAEHIDLLNDRLNKRGYSMKAEFINQDTQTNVLGEILDQSKNISVLSGTSFDVRA